MIFTGDIALPFAESINIPSDFTEDQVWIGNLEGSLVETAGKGVYNQLDAIQYLVSRLPYKAFGIANNHLMDAAEVQITLENLEGIGVKMFGAGVNKNEAKREIVIGDYVLVAFGWVGISCIPATKTTQGVNIYEKDAVISQVEELLVTYSGKRIIPFMHWNYELELYPQPLDRDLAHRLIDMGVYAVIGCHAHRVQPIELYNGRPIVYGLGNFAFRQNFYMNGKLNFPSFSYPEIAFEITNNGEFRVHYLMYYPDSQTVTYQNSTNVEDAVFSGMTTDEYIRFFKKNRVQKKLLPIFYYQDSRMVYLLKIKLVKIRQSLIKVLVSNKAAFNAVKGLLTKLS